MRRIFSRLAAGLILAGLALPLAAPASAATLRWANDGDVNSMDPYSRNETFLLTFLQNIYEPLVRRDKDLKIEPSLATEWTQTAPDVWRFKLRQGVKFSDGTPFTADDVIMSYHRARQPSSNMNSYFVTVADLVKVDDYTVEFHTKGPDPILPQELTNWGIMSKAWCEKNNATIPADLGKVTEENYATRNAMGTGPFMLKERVPDVRTVLVANPNWWDKPVGNVTEAVFTRIANPATRVAALLSGEIDFVYTVPPQDVDRIATTPGTKILKTPELRTIFLGFDQSRDELLESSVKGKNPFKDARVREAFYRAIDEKTIVAKVMRGQAQETALMVGPGINGFDTALNERVPYDPEKSKKLLADAGYPDGFETGMDCPNDRYVNDEAICQAVVTMLAKVGIKVNLLAQTRLKFFGKIGSPNYASDFYMLGWTPSTYDTHNMLASLVATRTPAAGLGDNNDGGISNAQIDGDIKQIQVETDPKKRQALISDALGIIKNQFLYIPLHQQVVVWAARSNVNVVQMADNYFPLRFVTVK
ncbi:ABC transporter substrate-binding protein [Aliidongia dinghuensis]|uniref:ABC transporter substrate-binding protein n=1 Tax=Aliidongia dinghuensis TaxID=1867774 RepID=A0A8J3E7I1_9PROT|nr:ABC transporter substrate-binding protein [Aliidongia dinghuensis]GGF41503.1 ABC transporter substrate-binding protein [Aliidongia dinghuensis]